MDNAVASFIHSLGDTRVLSREVELRLARIVAKGLQLERAVTARQDALGRVLTPAEIAKLQVLHHSVHSCTACCCSCLHLAGQAPCMQAFDATVNPNPMQNFYNALSMPGAKDACM